jgi:hypothetical protein
MARSRFGIGPKQSKWGRISRMNLDKRSVRGVGDNGADPWRRLAAAILFQAARDAHNPNGAIAAHEAGIRGMTLADDARRFLVSPAAASLALELGIAPEVYGAFVADLPPPAQIALPGLE